MGGFITGICSTIILMQITEINGRNSRNWRIIRTVRAYRKNGRTDQSSIIDLRNPIISHLAGSEKDHAEIPNGSCDDGNRSCFDALPMKECGIKTLDAVAPGLPKWSFPNLMLVPMDEVVTISLSVAVVIMAETLLAK